MKFSAASFDTLSTEVKLDIIHEQLFSVDVKLEDLLARIAHLEDSLLDKLGS